MKEISELIVVILEKQSSRKLEWEGDLLEIAYFRNRKIEQEVWREKQTTLLEKKQTF